MKTVGLITANYSNEAFTQLTHFRTLASLPFGGRYRLIDFALSNMVNSGINKVGIISPYNSGSLIDHIGAGKPWSLNKKHEGLFMMPGAVYGLHGTGGKFLFKDIIVNRAFFERSSNADYVIISSSTDVYNYDYSDLIAFHIASSNDATVMYKHVENAEEHWGYSISRNDEGLVESFDIGKNGSADFFMDCMIVNIEYMLKLIDSYSALEYMDIMEIFNIDNNRIGTFRFDGYLGSINSIKDYLKVSKDLFDYDIRNEVFNKDRTIYTKVQDDAPVQYMKGSYVKNSIIATGCKIEGTVEESIVFRSINIKKDAKVTNSVLMLYSEIGEGAVLENVICDKYVKVSPGAKIIGTPDNPIVLSKGSTI